MPLFEVAILEMPTDKEKETGKVERLVVEPTAVVAKDAESAKVQVLLDQSINLSSASAERLKVLVRPFAQ